MFQADISLSVVYAALPVMFLIGLHMLLLVPWVLPLYAILALGMLLVCVWNEVILC